VRDATGILDDFLAAGDFSHGIVQHLAVLGGDDRRELALALVEQLAVVEQDVGAAGQRGVAPGREGGVRRGDDLGRGVGTGQCHAGGDLAGGGGHDIAVAGVGGCFEGGAVGPVGEGFHGGGVLSRRGCCCLHCVVRDTAATLATCNFLAQKQYTLFMSPLNTH